jgi:hypothetical protein
MPPEQVLNSLHKKHWLVRRTQIGGDQFLLAVGRNLPTRDHKALGFYRLESPEGQAIMKLVRGNGTNTQAVFDFSKNGKQ